jgi:hypothetical protein
MAFIFGFDEPIDKQAVLEREGVQLSIWGTPVMRIVNAIPYVCAAPAGIATFRDLPLTTPSSAFRSDATFIEHKIMKANT